VHNVVRHRRVGSDVLCAAVFPTLPAGRYRPYRDGAVVAEPFTVVGGKVTEINWPYVA
jgi:hypothetical protein